MIFDTHAHYYDEAFDADRDALLASLPGRGVALVVCPGCDPESSRQSIALAEELTLPAIVHDRDAHRDCLDIVRAHPGVRGVFHCYSGSLEDAKVLVDKGWMLSFTGNITFKNARRAPDILRWLPLERLMLETDAPYMAPEPYRGQRCDSTMIARSAETVAQLRGLTRDEVEAVTLENGKKFFGIA